MKIALGSDHRGYKTTQTIKSWLESLGHEVVTLFECKDACDYPDAALAIGQAVASGVAERGILVCGTGIGMSIASNKVRGIRAALVADELSAQISREHNDANVICLSADLISAHSMEKIIATWLRTKFAGGRHERRVQKIMAIEHANRAAGDSEASSDQSPASTSP